MKTYYPIQVIDLKFQVDYVPPKKFRLREENDKDPICTNSFVIIKKK